jgi:hypothetical protein
VTNVEVVGGIPLVSVMGTPRTMGNHLGQRLKPKLQVLAQYLLEQFTSATRAGGHEVSPREVREMLHGSIAAATRLEPSLWMELESIATAAEISEEDLLLVHGYGDLMSTYHCPVPPSPSTFISLGAPHTDTGLPRMVLAWHLDPALLPYVTLVRRLPAHGPASLSLTIAGLQPMAGLSEAGVAVAWNELRVSDGMQGQLMGHLLSSALTAPSMEDVLSRVQMGPRHGGGALHLLSTGGERVSLEMSGQHQVRLLDPFQSAPRVHTNHPLHEEITRWSVRLGEATSKSRLEEIASLAIDAACCTPSTICSWFGLEDRDSSVHSKLMAETGINPQTTVLAIIDPAAKTMHLRRGGNSARLESVRL